MSLHCGVWAGALGKGDLSAPGTEPASRVGLGCLEDCVDAGRGSWWSAGGQARLAQNFDDDGGVFDALSRRGREDGQGAAALRIGGDVDGEDPFE